MAAPQGRPGTGTSCFCCALLVVGLLCALQEPPPPPTPNRAPRPPRPLRTFDDVKLDLAEEGYAPPPKTPLEAPIHDRPPAPRRAPGLPNRTKVALLQQARTKQTNNAVTLVVAGQAHLELLMNWLVAYRRHSSNYIVGCLDTMISDVLRQKGVDCVLVPNQSGPLMPGLRLREMARRRGPDARPRASVWESRMRMVLCLLRASYNVTIADTDAVFLSDASSWLTGYDLVASRGNFPEWSSARWGASLCLGLARFNPGAHVAALTKHLVERTQSLRDDQRAVNHVLHEADIAWAPETSDGKLLFATSTKTATGFTRLVKVGLLPHAKFVRDCSHGTRGAVVVHCVSRDAKRDALEKAGAWVLRDDWRDVADLRHMGVT